MNLENRIKPTGHRQALWSDLFYHYAKKAWWYFTPGFISHHL